MPANKRSESSRSALVVAIVGGIFLVLGAILPPIVEYILDANALAQRTSTPSSEKLVFNSGNNPNALNSYLQWEAGSSESSLYAIDDDTLNLTAGPQTWPNFPMIQYRQSLNGNLDVQVRLVFKPEASVLATAQMVGLLVRPVNAHLVQSDSSFPKDWVVAGRYITAAGSLVGCRGSWDAYPADKPDMIYLRLQRGANSWRCAYSNNGENWTWLNANVDDALLRDKQLAVSLFGYTITDNALTVKFADWVISTNQ
jgi:hypothetical protein